MGGAREIRPVYGRRCLVSAPGAPPRKLTGSRNHPAIAGRSMARIIIVDDEPPVLRSLATAALRRAHRRVAASPRRQAALGPTPRDAGSGGGPGRGEPPWRP